MNSQKPQPQAAGAALHVGVDVASEHLDAAVHGRGGVTRLPNTDAAIGRWLRTVPPGSRIAMESTGRYHERLARLAHAAGMVVFVLDPRAVRHYARGMGQRGKTDRLDAELLAHLIEREHGRLRPWQPSSPAHELLKDLLRQRAMLARYKASLQQGLRPAAAAAVDFTPVFKSIQDALRALDKQIAQAANALPKGKAALAWIMSVPGVGLLTGATLLRVFQRLAHRGCDAVVAFLGMDLRPMDSGKRTGVRRLSKRSDAYARKLLFTAAMAAVRSDEQWRKLYERELAKGLPNTAAYVAIGRRVIRVAFSVFKAEAAYDPVKMSAA
ncbi:MAG: transposase [Burkholderiaceae bacterium]